MELIIVTGMSGAGKSQASNTLEDMGFYCVDNVPPAIIPAFIDMSDANGHFSKMALITDIRGGELFKSIDEVLKGLDERNFEYKILFLDASDEVLIRRYKENRRTHPLNKNGKLSLASAVEKERKALKKIRSRADYIIDTSLISIAQLKEKVTALFYGDKGTAMKIQCKSFGFKYGADNEADLVFDVRCLPNPFYDENLKEKTGLEKEVQDYVLNSKESLEFKDKLYSFLEYAIPLYEKEGKSQLTVAFGCTGGKHRSVTFAQKIGEALKEKDYDCAIVHRDILKR